MRPWEEALVGGWGIVHPLSYILSAVAWSLCIRAALAFIRALKPGRPGYSGRFLYKRGWHKLIGLFLWSWVKELWPSRTYDLDPTILGTLELLAYPVLMKLEAWPVIGAWLGFKTVAQWDAWRTGRAEYNQFLIGNALVLAASLLLVHDVGVDLLQSRTWCLLGSAAFT